MKYLAPTTVADALSLLSEYTDAVVFAGATDVVPQLRGGRPEPSAIVDLKKIDRLMALGCDDDGWTIGAAVPAARIAADVGLRAAFPGLCEAAGLIGSDQIQNRSSLGGNLCNASPAADSVPALVANGATAVIAGPGGERTVPAAEVVTGPGRTSLAAGEFVVELRLARPSARTADAYLRLIPRSEMDIAVVGAAARVTLASDGTVSDAAVVLGAVAPTAVRVPAAAAALTGAAFGASDDAAALAAVAAAASAASSPIDDKRGTVEYRRQVAGVLARRAAAAAAQRVRAA